MRSFITSRNITIILIVGVTLGVILNLAFTAQDVKQFVNLREVPYVQSTVCINCHPDHYDSWYQTYHRTMTQEAGPEAILGDFDNVEYTYQGVTSRFTQLGDQYFITTLATSGEVQRYPVVFTVGSRRFQQYITKIGDRHIRLPLAWDIEAEHWFHLNGGFLDPDGIEFNYHSALWDANCIFCHNVKAQPGYNFQFQTFDARVAEFGIACEACHGPGTEHVTENTNPLRRYYLYLAGRDPTIYSPNELPQMQQIQLCGHCHGQRLPNPRDRIEQFISQGDPFTAGDDLNKYTTPIFQYSELEDIDLSLRFWADGTPRLTAYEYQGLLLSSEHLGTNLTCTSCHNMHGGDPKGMIDPEMRGIQGCVQCHDAFSTPEQIAAHTHHEPDSTGSSCYTCHMPKIVYGLLATHPSHRISNPDPSRTWHYNMPDACTLCHTNETAIWAASTLSQQYQSPLPEDLPASADFEIAENIRALLSGDVLQRATSVIALGEDDSYTNNPIERLWAVPFLFVTMEDTYPAIRTFAFRSLTNLTQAAAEYDPTLAASLQNLPTFDSLAEADERQAVLSVWQNWWSGLNKSSIPHPGPAVPLTSDLLLISEIVNSLLASQDSQAISIGE